jgi:4-amino-4-deoxy-L-arabinose transferase-like glycosyltransferase
MNRKIFILIIILVLAIIFRIYKITDIPPGLYPDEAMNGNNALEALSTGQFKVFYPENNGREGLFINIQSLFLFIFGNKIWALRLPSTIFGILTVLGTYLFTYTLFKNNGLQRNQVRKPVPSVEPTEPTSPPWGERLVSSIASLPQERIALIATFFLAMSFWHINFSRTAFRAIIAPFFLVWALFFLLRALHHCSNYSKSSRYIINALISGFLFGLGFYSYIAYRIMPILVLVIWLIYWFTAKGPRSRKKIVGTGIWFLVTTFTVGFPLVIYFFNNPHDFFGRTTQLSIFHSATPWKTLGENIMKTMLMFHITGDSNWRNNYASQPQVYWPVGILFLLGIILAGYVLIRKWCMITASKKSLWIPSILNQVAIPFLILLLWLIIAMFPVVISNEGIPHALRSILMIPPVFILAGIAGAWLSEQIIYRLKNIKGNIKIIWRGFIAIFFLLLIYQTYITYFILWAQNENTRSAFTQHYVDIAQKLNSLPNNTRKLVIVYPGGVNVRGIPMSAQTVMFITDTFRVEKQRQKHIYYMLPTQIQHIPPGTYLAALY